MEAGIIEKFCDRNYKKIKKANKKIYKNINNNLKNISNDKKLIIRNLYDYSNKFYEAGVFAPFKSFFETFSPVPYYLFCNSIELSLKVFLTINENETLKRIKQRGHDLIKCFDNNQKIYTKLTKKEIDITRMANNYVEIKGKSKVFIVSNINELAKYFDNLNEDRRFSQDFCEKIDKKLGFSN